MADFIAKIKDGKLDFGSDYNERRYSAWLKDNNQKQVKLEIYVGERSKSQNGLYWLYLGIIERETGNDAGDLHELFRRTLLAPKFIKVLGKEIRIPRSTTELKKNEFGDYMEKICAQTGVPIPDVESFKDERDSAPMINNNKK